MIINQVGRSHTANHTFTIRKPVARLSDAADNDYTVRLMDGTPVATIRHDQCMQHALNPNRWTVHTVIESTGERWLEANHITWALALRAALGHPGYGYDRYEVAP